jgi:lipid-A-disaccharide synthase
MRYYIIAGEASGDLHGGNLIRALHARDPKAEIRCWGGDLMEAAGATLVKHYRDLAFMGFVEVVANLPTILRNMRFCKRDILEFHPDVIIFIDYPGFNIPISKFAKAQGLKTVYYISPQVWAWKEGRVHTLKKTIDRMLVILPFEQAFYKKWGWEVDYVGHPLLEEIARRQLEPTVSYVIEKGQEPLVALLPGSRKQEIRQKLPVMLEVAKHFPECRFVIAQAPGLEDDFLDPFTAGYPNVERVKGATYFLLMKADAALVTSGTATLETALFGVPEVVCYKGNPISFQIAKRLVRVPFISLVNLIMEREVVRELIQDDMNTNNLVGELRGLLYDNARRARISSDYAALKTLLSAGGRASEAAADRIIELTSSN